MRRIFICLILISAVVTARASWYWPFGSSEDKEPRLSELMEPVSLLIDEASDLAADGKISEAVEKYREALKEIDRIEAENPERAEKPEFASLKTKRAYVTAAIDSMLLTQARRNAKPVAVSDTTELERKLAAERGQKVEKSEQDVRKPEELPEVKAAAAEAEVKAAAEAKEAERKAAKEAKKKKIKKSAKPSRPLTKREQVIEALMNKNYEKAGRLIDELLVEKPNDAAALNLKAAKETAEGKFAEAERTLDQAISSNPRDYHAYYNMATLFLQTRPDNKTGARRYYETGRLYGGPVDKEIEEALD